MMKMNNAVLGVLTPHVFNKKIILALDERWLSYFENDNPKFKVVINDNKIMLIGPKINGLGPITENSPNTKEVSIIEQ